MPGGGDLEARREGELQSLRWEYNSKRSSPFGPLMDSLLSPSRHLESICVLETIQFCDVRQSYAWHKTYISISSYSRKTRCQHGMRKNLDICIRKHIYLWEKKEEEE